MSILELKKELYKYIDIGDDKFVQNLYEKAMTYMEQIRADKMIEEAEEDIKNGNLHSLEEVKDYIKNWKAS